MRADPYFLPLPASCQLLDKGMGGIDEWMVGRRLGERGKVAWCAAVAASGGIVINGLPAFAHLASKLKT